ncbi:MAG: J domain-containing protein [Chloroflexi bacterium]|nr:J domain-containing protein [Chloroflexota bacterium]
MAARKRSSQPNTTDKRLSADSALERLRERLNKKREYIAILELELFNTRAEMAEWGKVYNERIAPLEERLRLLRRMLYEALETQRGADEVLDGPEDFELPEEDEEGEDPFAYRGRANGRNGHNGKNGKTLPPKLEEDIRRLFRELAKRFHPDLTGDAEEKAWREQIMTRVNQAYTERDLETLTKLAEQPDRPVTQKKTREEEVKALRKELKRLDGVIADLKATIRVLEESPVMQLKSEARMQRRDGRDLLTEMEASLKEQIDDLEEHLTVLGIDSNQDLDVDESVKAG